MSMCDIVTAIRWRRNTSDNHHTTCPLQNSKTTLATQLSRPNSRYPTHGIEMVVCVALCELVLRTKINVVEDILGSSTMFFAGLILVTRNRFVLSRVNGNFIYD